MVWGSECVRGRRSRGCPRPSSARVLKSINPLIVGMEFPHRTVAPHADRLVRSQAEKQFDVGTSVCLC